jgi:hypothetical protein
MMLAIDRLAGKLAAGRSCMLRSRQLNLWRLFSLSNSFLKGKACMISVLATPCQNRPATKCMP